MTTINLINFICTPNICVKKLNETYLYINPKLISFNNSIIKKFNIIIILFLIIIIIILIACKFIKKN